MTYSFITNCRHDVVCILLKIIQLFEIRTSYLNTTEMQHNRHPVLPKLKKAVITPD